MNRLAQMPAGTRVFVDTNIFILYYGDAEPFRQACRDFFVRTARQELRGFTSVPVAAETIHRVMVAEGAERLSLSSQATVEHLQKHPAFVRQLTRHLQVASDIRRLGLDILPVTYKDLHGSKGVRSTFGLLTNDSLIVAVMRAHKLRHLASHDAAFERVTGIEVWRPA
jgi:predicted nucleic acid-binding protein